MVLSKIKIIMEKEIIIVIIKKKNIENSID